MASARPSLQLTLAGYDDVARAFNALPAKFQGQFLRPALRAGAKVMLKAVQLTAPKSTDAPHVSMTLKVRAMKRKTGRVGYVVITGKRGALGIKNPDTYYPAHLEYGYTRKGKHVPGTHWMRRGLQAGRAAASTAVAQELSRRMKASIGLEKLSDAEAFGGPDVEVTV